MYTSEVLDMCKDYLVKVGVDKQVIEEDFKDVYQVLSHNLPKVCILKENREGKGGNQTHIHVTGKSMQFFYDAEILEKPSKEMTKDVKEYLSIYPENLIDLRNRANAVFHLERNFEVDNNAHFIDTFTFKKIGRINTPPIQVQLSKIKIDESNFMNFRKCLFTKDSLVFLKKIDGKIIVIGIPNEATENFETTIINNFEEVELNSLNGVFHPQSFREVNYTTIASFKPSDEDDLSSDSFDLSKGIKIRRKRTERHQDIVKLLALMLENKEYALFENPVDCLAVKDNFSTLLFEIKTLNGSYSDEKNQVQKAFAQLCYYENFYVKKKILNCSIKKYAVFEKEISMDHIDFLKKYDIDVLWLGDQGKFFNRSGEFSL